MGSFRPQRASEAYPDTLLPQGRGHRGPVPQPWPLSLEATSPSARPLVWREVALVALPAASLGSLGMFFSLLSSTLSTSVPLQSGSAVLAAQGPPFPPLPAASQQMCLAPPAE